MAQMSYTSFARRALAAMAVLTIALIGLLFGANQFRPNVLPLNGVPRLGG